MKRLEVPRPLWLATWHGLRERGGGVREAACVWAGTREGSTELAQSVVFLDDLPGVVGARLQHRTSRIAVNEMLGQVRGLGLRIVGDIHTHPRDWVDLSGVDQAHPIEFRVGLVALVLPHFACTAPDLLTVGVHEYIGDGEWRRFVGNDAAARINIMDEDRDEHLAT